jgi:alpha/beta hydrolase family protein
MPAAAIDITSRRPYASGRTFGDTGAYDRIDGVITFAVDPASEVNTPIVDLHLAPTDEDGNVRFRSEFSLLLPADQSRGNRRLLVDVVNRGRKRAIHAFNLVTPEDDPADPVGDGFLMRHGYALASIGWQWDVPPDPTLLHLEAPHALVDGQPLRGQTAIEIRPHAPERTRLLANRIHVPYPAADLTQPNARLLVRDWEDGPDTELPRSSWRFARETGEGGGPTNSQVMEPSPNHIYLESGFEPGRIYQLVYDALGAPVVGAGLLAVREIASFLRAPSELNPTEGFDRAYAYGISQTGRMLRHLLHLGLNLDQSGAIAYDGLLPHVAGGRRGEFNHRFAQPSQQSLPGFGHLYPFTDEPTVDPYSERTEGLLDGIRALNATPKVIYTNSSSEYWRGDGSLVHIDPTGSEDAPPAPETRVYHLAGTQHVPGVMPPNADPGGDGARPRYPRNVVDYNPLLRAALTNLDAWVTDATEPPPSRHLRLDHATAVPRSAALASLPTIPGLDHPDPDRLWVMRTTDVGPDAANGVGSYPVEEGETYPALVSALDDDGNELAGIRLPDLTVPLATNLPWNLRDPESGAPEQIVPMIGASHFFPPTEAARAAANDPRPSIEQRYPTREAYLNEVRAAARTLVDQRYLLQEDIETLLTDAATRYDYALR